MLSFLKSLSPDFLKTFARKTRAKSYAFFDKFEPYLTQRRYLGHTLYYTRGTGLIERIRFGNLTRIYEPELVDLICTELKKHPNPVFLDIGTNIGLISISVLHHIPNVQIFGFEPGPTPYKSFATTIFANQIGDKVTLYNEALDEKPGTISFFQHSDKDCGGDGMFDTHRAESTSTQITVVSNTLDIWYKTNSISHVHVVKIDIEGAELFALRGAVEFLKEFKPVIFLEISIENLKVYPYKEKDIFEFLKTHNYDLFDINGEKCSAENISERVTLSDTFIAKPNK